MIQSLALLYYGFGGSPLPPAALGGGTRFEMEAQAGFSPHVGAGLSLWRGANCVGWDTTLRFGPTYVRFDPGLWIHGGDATWAVGARIGPAIDLSRYLDVWFGGSAQAQVARTLGEKAVLSASGGVEVVSGLYVETSLGPHPYGVGDLRLDYAANDKWTVSVASGWPTLLGASASVAL